jgi:hypothetical protein
MSCQGTCRTWGVNLRFAAHTVTAVLGSSVSGYIYVWASYSIEGVKVRFDDLAITHTGGCDF